MTAKEFIGWVAYSKLEPFDETRADARSAQITQMVHNANVDRKNQKAMKEFMLRFDGGGGRKQTVADQVRVLNALANAQNMLAERGQ